MLQGKGFYTWQIPNCEGGNPAAIVAAAKSARLTHLVIKVADGTTIYTGKWGDPHDTTTPVIQALKAAGIQVWGWHYVYGADPIGEANLAIKRVQQLQLDGYVIDAEKEYKESGKKTAASRFMAQLRGGLPTFPVALSSYRYPSLHPQLPWKEFLSKCTLNMPQVYWIQGTDPAKQLVRCYNESLGINPNVPVIPTGAAFTESNWTPSVTEIQQFMEKAKALNLSAVNFWVWDDARSSRIPAAIWETISAYNYPGTPDNGQPAQDICQKLIAALNARDVNQVLALYTPTAAHVTAQRSIQGTEAIRAWYNNLFNQMLPNSTFVLSSFTGNGPTRHFTWAAASSKGQVLNGSDNLGLINDKIGYHFASFTITP